MSTLIPIHGIACPYGQWAALKEQNVYERVAPGAFGRMLSANHESIAFLIGSHAGPEITSTSKGDTRLFDHERVGLCFEILLDYDRREHRQAIGSIVRGGVDQASVQ